MMSKPPNPELARRILDIALEELGDKPPDKVNMRAIAERAGVSPTAIYYYFASKDELFERIKFDALEDLDRKLSVVESTEGGARGKLAVLVRVFVAWCLERPHVARLLMETLPPKEVLTEEGMGKYYSVFLRAGELIERGMADGEIEARSDLLLDGSVAQAALWGIVSQFQSKRVHPRFWDSIDPLVDRYLEIFFGKREGAE
jgi:AcrR family transcriptional regulator